MTWINSFWHIYKAEICKRISEAGDDESCLVENLCMVFMSHVYGNAFVAS